MGLRMQVKLPAVGIYDVPAIEHTLAALGSADQFLGLRESLKEMRIGLDSTSWKNTQSQAVKKVHPIPRWKPMGQTSHQE